MYDVFISYSRRDSDFVDKLGEFLEREKITFYRDTEDLPPAVIWRDDLKNAIIDADNIVFIVSPDSVGSVYCQMELDFADERKKRLIPIVLHKTDRKKIPKSLSKWQFLKNATGDDAFFKKVLKIILKEREWYKQGSDYLRRAENWQADPEAWGFLSREELAAARKWIEDGTRMEQGPVDLQIRYIQESEAFHLREAERVQELYSRALARQLAAQAAVMIDQRGVLLELAALLAVESMRRLPTLEGDRALRKALFLLPKRIAHIDLGKKEKIKAVEFSTDGKYMAGYCEDKAVRIWDLTTGLQISQVLLDNCQKFMLNPIQNQLLTFGEFATVWDIRDGQKISQLPEKDIRDAAFSSDGGFLVTIGADKIVQLWDTANWENFANYQNKEVMQFVAIAPDAKEVITWNQELAEIFRSPGKAVSEIGLSGSIGVKFAYGPDGKHLSQVVSGNYTASLFDIDSKQQILFEERHWYTAFSGDGRYYALASPEWDAHVYDLPSAWRAGHYWEATPQATMVRKHIRRRVSSRRGNSMHHDNSVKTVALSHTGKYLGTTSRDKTARVWESIKGREVLRLLEDVEGSLRRLVFQQNEKLLFGWGDQGLRTWEITGHRQAIELRHGDAVFDLSFSGDGRFIATVSKDRTCRVWELPGGKEIQRIEIKDGFFGQKVALNNDGSQLLLNQNEFFDVASGKSIAKIRKDNEKGLLAVSEDWGLVIKVQEDNSIIVYDFGTENEVARLKKRQQKIRNIAMNADATVVAIIFENNDLSFWQRNTGKESNSISRANKIRKLNFSISGSKLAILDNKEKESVEVWDTTSNESIIRIMQEAEVTSASFDASEHYLVTTSVDYSVRIWDLSNGSQIAQFDHDADVVTARFSPDGRYVASAGGRSDRTARLWFWHPEDLIAEACSRLSRDLTMEEWDTYLGGETYRLTRQIEAEADNGK